MASSGVNSMFLINFILRFLVGEGARVWAKSKGICLPENMAEADDVITPNFHFFCRNVLLLLFYCMSLSFFLC